MGKGIEVKFDKNFGRNLEREIIRMAQGHIDGLAREGTQAADRVHASHGGQPVEVVKPVLQRELKRAGLDLSDPELTRFAQQISDGGRVVIQSDRV